MSTIDSISGSHSYHNLEFAHSNTMLGILRKYEYRFREESFQEKIYYDKKQISFDFYQY